jgi:hypothetical protein
MSVIGNVGALAPASTGATASTSSRGTDFASRLDSSLGTGRTHPGQHHGKATTVENAATSPPGSPTANLAQTAATLFGNVFGALGASTGNSTTARAASNAYLRAA